MAWVHAHDLAHILFSLEGNGKVSVETEDILFHVVLVEEQPQSALYRDRHYKTLLTTKKRFIDESSLPSLQNLDLWKLYILAWSGW